MEISNYIINELNKTNIIWKQTKHIEYPIFRKTNNVSLLKNYFNKLFEDEEINLIQFNNIIQQYITTNASIVFSYYYNVINEKSENLISEISLIVENYSSSEKIFSNIENKLFQFIKKCNQLELIMQKYECTVNQNLKEKHNSFKIKFINYLIIMKILQTQINGVFLIKILDDKLEDYQHGINIIAELVEIYNILHNDELNNENNKYCHFFPYFNNVSYDNGSYKTFLKNIGKIPLASCRHLLHWLNADPLFISIYQIYFEDRIKIHKTNEMINYELDLLNLIKFNNDNDKQKYETMKNQLEERKTSIELNLIFQSINVSIKTEEYKNIELKKEICYVDIYTNYLWDISKPSNKLILPNEIKIYDDIIQKIYHINNNYNNLEIDDKNSSGVINIEINNNSYNFLVTFQQLIILTSIIKEKEITVTKLKETTGISVEEIEAVLNSLYFCDLLTFENDLFSINPNFFFTSNDISLLNTIDYNEKYDEQIISDIFEIIIQNKFKNVDQIVNEYIQKNGFINLILINNIIKYLMKQNIIIYNEYYLMNSENIQQMENLLE